MASVYDTANILAILAAARNPEWSTQLGHDGTSGTDADAYPSSAGAGVDLVNSVQALVAVEMRAAVHRRRSVVTVTTLDLTADYTVTINGTACIATGVHADLDALLTELALIINTNVPSTVTASADLTANTVTIVSDTNADYTITMSATGTGVLAIEADPTTAKLRLWAKCRSSSAPSTWIQILDQEFDVTSVGFLERFDVGGLDRLYVEVATVDGTGDGASVTYTTPVIKIGPCVSE